MSRVGPALGRILGSGASVLVTVVLSGCATGVGERSAEGTGAVVQRTWAAEIAEAATTASEYERRILHDGVVTAAELHDSHERVEACMRDGGFLLRWSDDGAYEVTEARGRELTSAVDARLERVRRACFDDWDQNVTYFFTEIRRNPDKRDEAEITVDCLRDAGLVGDDYTEVQWREDNGLATFPFDDFDEGAVQCRLDPLGLWRTP